MFICCYHDLSRSSSYTHWWTDVSHSFSCILSGPPTLLNNGLLCLALALLVFFLGLQPYTMMDCCVSSCLLSGSSNRTQCWAAVSHSRGHQLHQKVYKFQNLKILSWFHWFQEISLILRDFTGLKISKLNSNNTLKMQYYLHDYMYNYKCTLATHTVYKIYMSSATYSSRSCTCDTSFKITIYFSCSFASCRSSWIVFSSCFL